MKLTLEQTWKECLRMWKWIARKVENGSNKDVSELKKEWLKRQKKYKGVYIGRLCFFCHYSMVHGDKRYSCKACPGRLVSKKFNCMSRTYHYLDEPVKFYKKLLQLDAKRRKQNDN